MFDGQFKSKPTQTLRGSSFVKDGADDVIKKNRLNRQNRQNRKDEELAATTIQSFTRTFLVKAELRKRYRQDFDHCSESGKDVLHLASLSSQFFDPALDSSRLDKLLRLLVNSKGTEQRKNYLIGRTVLCCVANVRYQLENGDLTSVKSSVDFMKLVSQSNCEYNSFIHILMLKHVKPAYQNLVIILDTALGNDEVVSSVCVEMLQIFNRKFSSIFTSQAVLNENIKNRDQIIKLFVPSLIKYSNTIFSSFDMKEVKLCIFKDFNLNFPIFINFVANITDVALYSDVLACVYNIMNTYEIDTESDDSISDSESEDSTDTGPRFNLDMLDILFTEPTLEICNIIYLMVCKFNLSIIESKPLRNLCFNRNFLTSLWSHITTMKISSAYTGKEERCIDKLTNSHTLTDLHYQQIIPLITVFSSFFSQYLLSSHDVDVIDQSVFLFKASELKQMCHILRDLTLYLSRMDLVAINRVRNFKMITKFTGGKHLSVPGSSPGGAIVLCVEDWLNCTAACVKLAKELYSRDTRLGLLESSEDWLAKVVVEDVDLGTYIDPDSVTNLSLHHLKQIDLLHNIPFIIPFENRISIFHRIVEEDKKKHQAGWGNYSSGNIVSVTIRREYIYEDAFLQLTELRAPTLKEKLKVTLINYSGLDEAGIDGGGLFREFLSAFLTEAFNPNRGLFIETEGLLHPNPAAQLLYPDHYKHFFFVGRMLGKAIYERLLVDIPLAQYFLHKLLGGQADINHLRSLDQEMYKNMLSLRNYNKEVFDELCLSFIATDNILGETKTIDLKPSGANIPVTQHNLIEYIHLMADYRLNKQIRVGFRHFTDGLYSVVSPNWLGMFNSTEFQNIISGAVTDIDVADLRANSVYHGAYNEEHPTIQLFWEVVEEMSPEEHRKLLTFVTSCSRTPLLGFKELFPLFSIHSAGVEDRLPTASTCMNLLKLPEFNDKDLMKQRLCYVIESGAGFELS